MFAAAAAATAVQVAQAAREARRVAAEQREEELMAKRREEEVAAAKALLQQQKEEAQQLRRTQKQQQAKKREAEVLRKRQQKEQEEGIKRQQQERQQALEQMRELAKEMESAASSPEQLQCNTPGPTRKQAPAAASASGKHGGRTLKRQRRAAVNVDLPANKKQGLSKGLLRGSSLDAPVVIADSSDDDEPERRQAKGLGDGMSDEDDPDIRLMTAELSAKYADVDRAVEQDLNEEERVQYRQAVFKRRRMLAKRASKPPGALLTVDIFLIFVGVYSRGRGGG